MKKLLKGVTTMIVAVLLTSALAAPARAVNLDEAWMGVINAIGAAARTESMNSECLNLKYVGTSTQAVVAVTDKAVTFYAPFNVVDTSIGASGIMDITSASYDTVGEVCDAVNLVSSYRCEMRGCKRDDSSTKLRDLAAKSGGQDLQFDSGYTSLIDSGSGGYDPTTFQVYDLRIGILPATGRRVVLKKVIANANVAGSFRVFGKLRKFDGSTDGLTRDDTTKVWQAATADDTDLTADFTASGIGGLEFAKGAHVVLSAGNGTGLQLAANYMTAAWEER